MARLRKTRRHFGVVILIIILWLTLGTASYVVSLPSAPIATETLPNASDDTAIVVFTGGSSRIASGLELLNRHHGEKLFISGVARGTDVQLLIDMYQHDPQQFACCVVIGETATNTIGNAQETALWLNMESYQTIILVTAAYHMPRAKLEMISHMPAIKIIPYPVFLDHVPITLWYKYPATAWLLIQEAAKMAIRMPIYAIYWLEDIAF
ncbi:MAG: YdcF family protein [Pseudomonadota bacterium]